MITDNQIDTGLLKADLKDKVTYTLLRKHRHQTKKSNLRSLADIGKTVSSASRMFSNTDNGNTGASLVQFFFFFYLYSTFLPFLCIFFASLTFTRQFLLIKYYKTKLCVIKSDLIDRIEWTKVSYLKTQLANIIRHCVTLQVQVYFIKYHG